MSETDRIIEALRQNPYEKIHRRLRTCSWCGEGIFEGDNYYKIAGRTYCERCVDKSKVLG